MLYGQAAPIVADNCLAKSHWDLLCTVEGQTRKYAWYMRGLNLDVLQLLKKAKEQVARHFGVETTQVMLEIVKQRPRSVPPISNGKKSNW